MDEVLDGSRKRQREWQGKARIICRRRDFIIHEASTARPPQHSERLLEATSPTQSDRASPASALHHRPYQQDGERDPHHAAAHLFVHVRNGNRCVNRSDSISVTGPSGSEQDNTSAPLRAQVVGMCRRADHRDIGREMTVVDESRRSQSRHHQSGDRERIEARHRVHARPCQVALICGPSHLRIDLWRHCLQSNVLVDLSESAATSARTAGSP